MQLPTGNQLKDFQKYIEDQHKKLNELFPEMIWKFYTTECVKDSELSEQINKFKTKDETLIPTEDAPRRHVSTLGSYIYGTGDVSDDNTYNRYMSLHVQDIPSRALAFTPNGRRRSYHADGGKKTLSLAKGNTGGMFCIPLDIDKKDYDKVGYPLPEELSHYNSWKDVDPVEFVYWWFDATRDLVPDAFEGINEYFYKKIVNNISWINITPGGFHGYIMIDPEELEDPFFKNMSADDYNFYMKGFHKIVGSDLMLDSSRVNLTDVMRLPGSLHRKFKQTPTDYKNSYICVPCPIKSINYDKAEHVVELGEPFSVSKDTIKYAEKGRVKLIFTQIKQWVQDPDILKHVDRYRNDVHTKKYIDQRGSKLLSISEKEIWRCCMYHGLSWGKVIDNLPGGYISFDSTYGSLKFRQPSGVLEHTSGYKFKVMPLMSEDMMKKASTGIENYNDEGLECNYCGGYVNDGFSKHDRPAGPMINFVFMYMQQFVCPPGALTSEIYEEVKNYFKQICPDIDESLISNGSKLQEGYTRYGKPSCYIECRPDRVMCNYIKQTSNGKEVDMNGGMIVFDKGGINFVGRTMMINEGAKFISNNEEENISVYKANSDGVYTKDFDEYTVRYLLQVNGKTFSIAPCAYAGTFEKQLMRNNTGLHFLGSDEVCKRFFNALDAACDEEAEYPLKTIRGNQGSKYGINKETGKPYCVIGDRGICGDCPTILEAVDDTARDIMDDNLTDVSVEEYRDHVNKLGEAMVYQKIFISAWSCQFMNIVEDVMRANLGITLGPNVNIYGGSETGKSSLRCAIQASFGYRPGKKYLSMQMATPQPLIDSMLDGACMLYEEMTSKVESDQKKQEAKEIVIRGAANKETKMTGGVQAKKAVKMRSCNIYFGESSIRDDSANNRIIKVKLTKGIRNPNKEEGERELRRLQNHTIRGTLYPTIMNLYSDENKLFGKLIEYKKLISAEFDNERLGDLEAYGMVLYVDAFKLGTVDQFIDMIRYNVEADVSNVRDLTGVDPMQAIESLIYGLMFRAEQEKSYISYGRFDTFPDDRYNNYGEGNFTTVVKIDLSTIKTSVTNYDNDVEKINEIMPGFVKTIGKSIYIVSYGQEFLNRLQMLNEEGFIELDMDSIININGLVRDTINLMCNGKNFQSWYSLEKATHSTACPELFWLAIRKVIYTLGVQL